MSLEFMYPLPSYLDVTVDATDAVNTIDNEEQEDEKLESNEESSISSENIYASGDINGSNAVERRNLNENFRVLNSDIDGSCSNVRYKNHDSNCFNATKQYASCDFATQSYGSVTTSTCCMGEKNFSSKDDILYSMMTCREDEESLTSCSKDNANSNDDYDGYHVVVTQQFSSTMCDKACQTTNVKAMSENEASRYSFSTQSLSTNSHEQTFVTDIVAAPSEQKKEYRKSLYLQLYADLYRKQKRERGEEHSVFNDQQQNVFQEKMPVSCNNINNSIQGGILKKSKHHHHHRKGLPKHSSKHASSNRANRFQSNSANAKNISSNCKTNVNASHPLSLNCDFKQLDMPNLDNAIQSNKVSAQQYSKQKQISHGGIHQQYSFSLQSPEILM